MTVRVEARNLSLDYGDVEAIRDVSMSLADGRIYGLLGRNGSGKTSLMSLLAGFRRPTAGEALVDGEPVFENGNATRKVCLIREGADTVDSMEKVEAGLEFAARMRPYWDDAYARRLLDRFELSARKKVGDLSRGQRAALAVTLGLASRAPVTMFDEAYLGLDAPSRYVFYDELLRDFMEHPRLVVVSTHLIEEVSLLFEEVLILHEGRLILQDEAEAFRMRGANVIGPRDTVDRFVAGMTVLERRELGPTASAVVYGEFDDHLRRKAVEAGLEVGPLPLQDLFVHLTSSQEGEDDRS